MDKNRLKYLIDALLFICMVGLAGIGYLQGFFLAEGPVEDVTRKYFMGLHTHQWGHIHFYISLAFSVLIIIHLILSWNWIKATSKKIFKNKWGTALVGMVIVSLLIPLIFWAFSLPHVDEYAEYGTGGGRGLGRKIALSEEQAQKENTAPRSYNTPKNTQKEYQKSPEKELVESPVKKEEPVEIKEHGQKGESMKGEEFIQKEEQLREEEHLHEGRQEHEGEQRLTRGRLEEYETGILITGQTTLLELEQLTEIPKATILKEMGLPTDIPYRESLGRLKRRYNFTMQELRDKIEALIRKKNIEI